MTDEEKADQQRFIEECRRIEEEEKIWRHMPTKTWWQRLDRFLYRHLVGL